ncbi:hypothetical protein [Methanobrevibacter sp.]
MVQIESYKPFETDIWFYAEEGDATKYSGTDGEEVLVMSAEVKKGDYVKLSAADKTIEVASDAGDIIIGQVIDNPIWRKDRPNATSVSGNYNKRICTVRLFGYYVHNVHLKEENSAVDVGDTISYAGNNRFDKDADGKAIALQSATAGSQAKIPVLMQLIGF